MNWVEKAGQGRLRGAASAFLGMLLVALVVLFALQPSAARSDEGWVRPNILFVLTDDQTAGTIKYMRFVNNRDDWIRFTEAYTNTPLCCPARATLLTGQYSHHTGVDSNGAGENLDEESTLPVWFDRVGYTTGYFGKYLNYYPFDRGNYVPPGWDRWIAFTGHPDYFNYDLNVNGRVEQEGERDQQYSTDLLARRAVRFVKGAREPFFAWYGPLAPHLPRVPAPRHRGVRVKPHPQLGVPNWNDPNGGKTGWWRSLPPVSEREARVAANHSTRSLLAVDEAVRDLFAALEKRGVSERTVIVLLSDNGFSFGAHRYMGKDCGYDECIHIPLFFRVPGFPGGRTDALVSNVDVPVTIADLANVRLPDADGTSLAPIIVDRDARLNRGVLLRTGPSRWEVPPLVWGVRTERWKYLRADDTGFEELYDLRSDPYELENLAGVPWYGGIKAILAAYMEDLRGK